MELDLTDRVVLLTGAAGGIGRASTKLLVESGAYVVCVDRDGESLESLVDLVPADRVKLLAMDLSGADAAAEVLKKALEWHGNGRFHH